MATVLVVDDDSANRMLLTSILKYERHTVLEAENGEVGLELAASHMPDLVIVDLYMPIVDGVTFVRRVRENPRLTSMRLAISTGTNITAAMEDFFQMHRVETVIPKPSEAAQIIELIRSALS